MTSPLQSIRFDDPVHVLPVVAWLQELADRFADEGLEAPLWRALGEVGWANGTGERRYGRWVKSSTGMTERRYVEDALEHAGVSWEEVYDPQRFPGLFAARQRDDVLAWIDVVWLAAAGWNDDLPLVERWCEYCREMVSVDVDETCLWCTGPTLAERPRRRGGRPAGKYCKLTDEQLGALHLVYERDGLSVNDLADRVWQRAGYSSRDTCASAIYKGWKRLGLRSRDRLEAVRQACTIHGLAPKHGPRPGYAAIKRQGHRDDQPQCEGVRANPPGKGERCKRPAQFGSKFCPAHDPARAEERQAHLAGMRSRMPAKLMVPFAPLQAWLLERHAELGSWRAVGNLTGLDDSQAHRWGCGLENGKPKEQVGLDIVLRIAAAAGVAYADMYPAGEEAQAA